ncbi:bacillithiol system redox-active protein YtxJ [Barrientosiimonas marina]|uniref:Bacillithiol system redox-active protein YtxJ n=1 Tax=Lentibacillus kimchii TaxID=1542911 RepID=A0ABW2USP7_9BACI
MTDFKELQTKEELEQMWKRSTEKPVLVLKHSTTCPISAEAFKQYQAFLESGADPAEAYLVKVIESRDLSNQLAEETGVKHESPQLFLLQDNHVRWHTSHSAITEDAINQALQQA